MWSNPEEAADLVTFAEEIVNWKLYFLYSVLVEGQDYWGADSCYIWKRKSTVSISFSAWKVYKYRVFSGP